MRNLFVISTLLTLPTLTLAQVPTSNAPTAYVRASYTKWKPGLQAEGQTFVSDVVNKGVAASVAADPESLGSIRLYRVFPSSAEIGHDAVTLQFRKSPPDLGQTTGTQPFYNAIGMSRDQYVVKISSVSGLVKQEVWTDTYRQGSIQEGDLVQIRFMDPPPGKATDFIEVSRQFESPVRAELIRRGAFKASQLFRLWGTEEEAPYNFVNLIAYKDSASLFKPWPSRIDAFRAAHPNASYGRYVEQYGQSSNVTKIVVYRVAFAIWK